MRIRPAVVIVAALVMVAGFGVFLRTHDWGGALSLPKPAPGCTVQGDGPVLNPNTTRTVSLDAAQMANAATIAAIGARRNMPERAVTVALATAFQESKLENLVGGDRDSVGLFQQRPSQGWGTREQIRDPRYAANRFYAALNKVRGWEKMRVTEAAQAVQRSAFPEAYEKWADEASVLSKALLGYASGAVACTVAREPVMRGSAAAAALTSGLLLDWGTLGTASPAELTGLAVSAADAQVGWRYAHWLVSHASDHGVKRVRFGDLEWTADLGRWSKIAGASGAGGQVIAEVFR